MKYIYLQKRIEYFNAIMDCGVCLHFSFSSKTLRIFYRTKFGTDRPNESPVSRLFRLSK